MGLTKDQRDKIAERLSRGDKAAVARRARVSRMAVTKWFSGEFDSDRIEDAAIDTLEASIKRRKEIDARLNAILSM